MSNFLWWRDGIIYQIYPRSFADSNADGVGDLPGILSRLDYLAELGIDAIWLSPIYPSPDCDFGYDVSDYCAIDPRYGTLEDFDRLVSEAHQRGIRVILDLVLNHTSDQHAWFQESRLSRDNPKADWYLWRDKPNNYRSWFGGTAWTFSPQRGQYYLHTFLAEQPDLNWRNPDVRKAILDVVRFWLDRGVDGFRLDVFNAYFKDAKLRNNPFKLGMRSYFLQEHIHDMDQPEMIPLLNELRQILDSYPERYAVGETFLATPQKAASYCGPDKLHAAFNFDFTHRPFRAGEFLDAVRRWILATGDEIWPNYVLSNHDVRRSATRYGYSEGDARLKVVLGMLLTLRGTPFLYYGEEIGMRDIHLKRNEILDPPGRRYWPLYPGRDGCRSPMQWEGGPNAGFSTAKPWLPVHPNHTERNVAAQKANPGSLFNFTRELIAIRKKFPALQHGSFRLLGRYGHKGMAYLRTDGDQMVLVGLNFTKRPITLLTRPESGLRSRTWKTIFTNKPEGGMWLNQVYLQLQPYEVLLKTAE